MKLRFLCANHRQWLQSQPEQAIHWCSNSFETGWHLSQDENWKDALPHMGCAFETAEILLTTRAISPSRALEWLLNTLEGLTKTLEKLNLMESRLEVYQIGIDRLRKEAAGSISPELEANLYSQINRLNRARRQFDVGRQSMDPMLSLREAKRGEIVFH